VIVLEGEDILTGPHIFKGLFEGSDVALWFGLRSDLAIGIAFNGGGSGRGCGMHWEMPCRA